MSSFLVLMALLWGADEDMSTEQLRDEIQSVQAQTDQYVADNADLTLRIDDLEAKLAELQEQISETELQEHSAGGDGAAGETGSPDS